MPGKIHFVFAGTQSFLGGGTSLWKTLFRSAPCEIRLHYSSFAREIWQEFSQNPRIVHVIHEGWTTYENARSPFPWANSRGFRVDTIGEGDIVIFDSREALQQLSLLLARRKARLFWHMQNREHLLRKKLWIVPWDFRCYQKLEAIFAVSNFVKARFERDWLYRLLGGKIPIEVIYNSIESDYVRIPAERDFIVYFGRYERLKHPLFLEKLPYEVRYIGSSRGCARPVNVPKSRDLGWMSPREAARYGDIFIFPSTNEAFGLALLEMMSYGKIVIAFRSGAFPELIEDKVDGFLVKPFDTQTICEILDKIRSDPVARDSISRKAIEKSRRFDAEQYRNQFFSRLERLVHIG